METSVGERYLLDLDILLNNILKREGGNEGQGELAFSLEELEAPDIASPPGRFYEKLHPTMVVRKRASA
ncbi:unnamed protein product [Caretta caretta]